MTEYGKSFSARLGENLALYTKQALLHLITCISQSTLSFFRVKKNAVLFGIVCAIVLGFVIAVVCYRSYDYKKQVLQYYKIQANIVDSPQMSVEDIKATFLKPFSGILLGNNALNIASIMAGKGRYEQAVEVLEFTRSKSMPDNIKDMIELNILALKIQAGDEDPNLKPVTEIAKSKSRFALLAQELLAEVELFFGREEFYYARVSDISKSKKIKSPYMMERFQELQYIASQNVAEEHVD